MSAVPLALLLTDLVDSSGHAARLGDEAMARLSAAHDRIARDLLRRWRGHEIDKTDGFLLLFAQAADALGYALDYHREIAALPVPLQARAGLHVGEVTIREASDADVALGAKPFEVDGVSKPLAARVMSTALGGQTLLTRAAVDALHTGGGIHHRLVNHGHWFVKGLPVPVELFEVGETGTEPAIAPFTPPPDSAKVWRVVKEGEHWLPVRSIRHTLPAERDAFVGRNDALRALAERFDGGARLVSLVGIGGGGKTRLATRFGWRWLGDYPGGVWFCDLAPARGLDGLVSAVAQGLELPLGKDDAVVQIGQALAGRGRCLVVLDNFEHLARLAEASVGRWLDRAAEAVFLVTTREVLGIAGEATLALPPLPLPDAEALFMRRAEAARPDFAQLIERSADERAAVGRLVQLLDALPLAIELAAARVRTLAPSALLARMSERFKLLASGGGRLDRQATLRATFDWSWGLLPEAEKAALAQLSVFEGGFTLEAAEAVIELSSHDGAPWTLDAVNALVDKSFVRSQVQGRQGRLELLGSVQVYAAEHLHTEGRFAGSGAAARRAAEERHGRWAAALGTAAAMGGRGIELDNLVAACRRAVLRGDVAVAAAAVGGAWAAFSLRGPYAAGLELAREVGGMPALPSPGHEAAHASALLALGQAEEATGQRERAAQRYEKALALCAQAPAPATEALALLKRATLELRSGQAEQARQRRSRALQLARQHGLRAIEIAVLNAEGVAAFEAGDIDAGRRGYEEALALARASGDLRWQGSLLGNLGNLHATAGRLAQAREHAEAALRVLAELGDRGLEATTLVNLGMLRLLQGALGDAADALARGLAMARELGHRRLECVALGNLGVVSETSQQADEALAHFAAAVALAAEIGDRRSQAQFAGHHALMLARLGRHAEALQEADEALALMQALGDALSLALLHVQAAEVALRAGDATTALHHREQAEHLARSTGAAAGSEIDERLKALRALPLWPLGAGG